mgnify:CR=1 FL=1
MRPRRRLRVILHAKDRVRAVAEAFERIVVEVDMCEVDVVLVEAVGIDGKPMILDGDFDFVRQFI